MIDPVSIGRHIRGALLHLPGFGPKKIEALRTRGLATWSDLLHAHHHDLPGLDTAAPPWLAAIRADEAALARGDLLHLVSTLHRSDHWRILADFHERATYLDIETSGEERHPDITLIIAKHRGRLHTFTAEHNLDRFLDLLDGITLLVTFNGASFDVPQMERHFHLPFHDIAHVDLRWVCYHARMRGGLKEIERAIGLIRPPDLIGMDGAEADWLWRRWKLTGQRHLLERLTRYCAADVIGLEWLTHWLIAEHAGAPYPVYHWNELPPPTTVANTAPETSPSSITNPPAPPPTAASSLEQRLRDRSRARRDQGSSTVNR